MADTQAPLLDLDSLIVRPSIAIDSKLYEILSPDEISVMMYHGLGSGGRRIDALIAREELSVEETGELQRLVHVVADDIMQPVPEEVRARLSDAQRLDVISVFFGLSLRKRAVTAAAAALKETFRKATTSTGEPLSPGSSGSTVAPPPAGSATSPSPSCGPT